MRFTERLDPVHPRTALTFNGASEILAIRPRYTNRHR